MSNCNNCIHRSTCNDVGMGLNCHEYIADTKMKNCRKCYHFYKWDYGNATIPYCTIRNRELRFDYNNCVDFIPEKFVKAYIMTNLDNITKLYRNLYEDEK